MAYLRHMPQHLPRQCSSILCGAIGDDANGRLKKPPAMARMLETKAAAGAFDPKRAVLS